MVFISIGRCSKSFSHYLKCRCTSVTPVSPKINRWSLQDKILQCPSIKINFSIYLNIYDSDKPIHYPEAKELLNDFSCQLFDNVLDCKIIFQTVYISYFLFVLVLLFGSSEKKRILCFNLILTSD